MSRFLGIVTVLAVILLAMGFAAANAGHRVTLSLGIVTLYRAPVTLVAFGGLLTGMVVMFAAGVHTDLKVRRILRDRLAQETRQEQVWTDKSQRDLFTHDGDGEDRRAVSPAPRPLPTFRTPEEPTD